MTELYLIAHKVRGEPAFDVAQQMECAECHDGQRAHGCAECDGLGFWWVIPTSGHRAYPWAWAEFEPDWLPLIDPMPPALPDHYPERKVAAANLAALLAKIIPQPPSTPLRRR